MNELVRWIMIVVCIWLLINVLFVKWALCLADRRERK